MSRAARYRIHEQLPEVGPQGQDRFRAAHLAVVGAGGLGCSVLQQLVSLGPARLTIVDGDVVAWSNLQRQLLYGEDHIGRPKVEVAREVLAARNSEVDIRIHPCRLTAANAAGLLAGADIILDCTDNLPARLVIDDYCGARGIPLVYGGVRGFEGQVAVFHHAGAGSFRATFPDLDVVARLPTCTDSGVLAPVVALTASLQVNEVVKLLLNLPGVLSGGLQTFDLLRNVFRTYRVGPAVTQN